MEQRIVDICEKLCNKTLEWEEPLFSTGLLDSYLIMELIAMLEIEFQIMFDEKELQTLENFQCINNIIEIVRKKL